MIIMHLCKQTNFQIVTLYFTSIGNRYLKNSYNKVNLLYQFELNKMIHPAAYVSRGMICFLIESGNFWCRSMS